MSPQGDEARYWRYDLGNGWEALAGRSAADNDALTFGLARPRDLWLHVKGVPGSHVVLRNPESDDPPRETVLAAAAIAAWHSKSRRGGMVAVNLTQACHVCKPSGAEPGSVRIKRESTVKVRPGLPGA